MTLLEMYIRRILSLTRIISQTVTFWASLIGFSVISVAFGIYRRGLKSWARKIHPDWGRMLSGKDSALWEDLEAEDADYLSSVMILGVIGEGEANLTKVRSFFEQYVLNYKNLRGERPYDKFYHYHEQWLGYPFWRRARDFDVKNHIKMLEEFQKKEFTTKEEVEKWLGEYHGKPFGRKCPPWELLVIRNYVENEDEAERKNCCKKFVLLFRWHHTLGDTCSIAKILINIFGGETNDGDFLGGGENVMELGEDGWWTGLKRWGKNCLLLGRDMLSFLVVETDKNIWRVSSDMLAGNSHLVSTKKLPFNVARIVSKKEDVGVTSILYSAVAGGIRQYFIDTGQGRRIPDDMNIRISLPFKQHPNHRLINYWSVGNIKLPVGEPESILRLHRVERMRHDVEESWVPGFLHYLKMLQGCLPNYFSKFNFKDCRTTMVGWNFPGPNEEILLLGEYPALEFISYHPRLLSDAAIGLSILSYNGTIRFFLSVDQTLFPCRESALKLANLIEKEFLSLQHVHEENDVVKYSYEPRMKF